MTKGVWHVGQIACKKSLDTGSGDSGRSKPPETMRRKVSYTIYLSLTAFASAADATWLRNSSGQEPAGRTARIY